MKRGVTIFILITVVVLGFAVHSVWTLLGLLVATGREDAILRGELPAPNSGTISERPQLIPKIIHQTYKNESIPEHWKGPQQSCLDLHPDYEYKVCRMSPGTRRAITNDYLAMDRQKGTRIYCRRVPMVSRDLRRVPLPYPTRRCHSILCATPFWRNLH
jgi:hypothetical protein